MSAPPSNNAWYGGCCDGQTARALYDLDTASHRPFFFPTAMSFRDAKANEAESSTASSSPIDTSTSRCGRNQSALGFWKSDHSLAVGSLAEVTFNTSNVGSHSVIHNVYGDHIVHPLSCCCTLGGGECHCLGRCDTRADNDVEDGREAAAMLPLKHHRRREPLIESLEPPEIDAYYTHHVSSFLEFSRNPRRITHWFEQPTASLRHSGTSRTRPERTPVRALSPVWCKILISIRSYSI